MLIKELVFHNFGVFKNRQHAVLTPVGNKPVVLFGGLNGAGKTTLLEGIQLALYGKLSPIHRQRNISYESYLQQLIHRAVKPSDGASLEVVFRFSQDEHEPDKRLRRTWSVRGSRVVESLDLFVDDRKDEALTETWTEQIERMIPPGLSQLFFFDGERIEALADPEQSAIILSTAIDALLGMDLVKQLQNDLQVVERRKHKEIARGPAREELESVGVELEKSNERIGELKQQSAHFHNTLDRAQNRAREVEARFNAEGGSHLEQRQELEKKKADLQAEFEGVGLRLAELATGALPLALVGERLEEIAEQAVREEEAQRTKLVTEALGEHQQGLLKRLREHGAGKDLVAVAKQYFAESKEKGDAALSVECYLGLGGAGLRDVKELSFDLLRKEREQAARWLEAEAGVRNAIDEVERRLAAIPDEEALAPLLAERAEVRAMLETTELELATIQEQVRLEEMARSKSLAKDEELVRGRNEAELGNEEVYRFLKHSQRARETAEKFRSAAVKHHAAHLERSILEGYTQLLHKQSLVSRVQIDPDTCRLMLYNREDQQITAERLAAGERQLLAVSILWGLARASGRLLPVVIDTPLGRLDAAHRSHLVTRYFPYASHQVLLLSTDEEIDSQLYAQLKPWIGRSYRLEYEDDSMSTTINPGYFWEG